MLIFVDCSGSITGLGSLGTYTTCQISSKCTAVECCLDSPSLGLTFNGYVRLDPCHYIIYIGIEGIELEYTLVDYTFGVLKHYSLNEVFNLE